MSLARDTLQVPDSIRGEVAEWSKAAVLKTARAKALVGSNPTLSATWPPCEETMRLGREPGGALPELRGLAGALG